MTFVGKGVAFIVFITWSLLTSSVVVASSIESLTWLPLFSAKVKKLQPDIACPQNQILGLDVDKHKAALKADIQKINWDLNCASTGTSGASKPRSDTEKKNPVNLFLDKLSAIPSVTLRIKTINLVSDLIKGELSSALQITKTDTNVKVALNNALFALNARVELPSQQLIVDASLKADVLPQYIHLTKAQAKYLNNEIHLHYQSDLTRWHNGTFTINWQGSIADISEAGSVSVAGDIDLLAEKIKLTTFVITAKQALVTISETQAWKSAFIKLKIPEPTYLDYGKMHSKHLPLHLRIGSSLLLTKVPRGKGQRIEKQKLPPLFAQALITANKNSFDSDISLSVLNQKLLLELLIKPESIQLQMHNNQVNLVTLASALSGYHESLSELEVTNGTLNSSVLFEYSRADEILTIESALATDNVQGKNNDILFAGVQLNSQFKYVFDKHKNITIAQDIQTLTAKSLFVGVPIKALKIDAKLNAGKPIIQHFKTEMLGGRVDFDDFSLHAPSYTILNVAGISLADIFKYSSYPEIESKAVIDGMLPLNLTEEGLEIREGIIVSRYPGGYIKVPESTVIKAVGNGNADFLLMMQLLSNFQFDTLQGMIKYTSDGESDIQVEIKGRNPDIVGSPPINFNYSHNENILKLLRALRFNDEIERNIKERY
ncbi:hypothetical protein CW745_08045 [Psychromonas sp. psych-6C06]|uniref:intermembrane phospholipid transport protein YdbH family protein n=1 Tax=Psychromonas sp. psych-6C06 TaxID=2058089 RepID=UPI000C321CB6|nr:YdbH domain-containing protein [Psychromonas sp. psych-6C06]PKF61929.1 hypothetical protein CW745_08045 [Psychromonas sp. psych-6C06]